MSTFVCVSCAAETDGPPPAICPWCLSARSFGIAVRRDVPAPTTAAWATTAQLVRRARSAPRQLPDGWREILGGWDGSPSSTLFFGPPGVGKSTLAMAGSHKVFASAVYLAAEEGFSATLLQRLSSLELASTTVTVVAGRELSVALAVAEATKAEVVVVDSINVVPIVPADIAGVLNQGRSLWLVAHATKDASDFKGPSWIGHAVDVVVKVNAREETTVLVEVLKSRWGPLGEARVPL